jgi:hypothetical protein
MEYTVIVTNKCMCRDCGDVIESVFTHHLVHCRCGRVFVDGGTSYLRRGGINLENIIEMSETYTMEI